MLQAKFHPKAAVESDEGAPHFWTMCRGPWYRHFIHGALHPDASQQRSLEFPRQRCACTPSWSLP